MFSGRLAAKNPVQPSPRDQPLLPDAKSRQPPFAQSATYYLLADAHQPGNLIHLVGWQLDTLAHKALQNPQNEKAYNRCFFLRQDKTAVISAAMTLCDRSVMVAIDAGAVTRITGAPIGTLNVWVQRGLIPGVSVGMQGRSREFDLDTVMHIAVMAALVQLGYGAPFSSMAAAEARENGVDKPGAKLIIGPPRSNLYGLTETPTIDYIEAETREALDECFDYFIDGRPEAFTIVELDRLAARVRQAFKAPDLVERAKRQSGVPERRSVRRVRSDD